MYHSRFIFLCFVALLNFSSCKKNARKALIKSNPQLPNELIVSAPPVLSQEGPEQFSMADWQSRCADLEMKAHQSFGVRLIKFYCGVPQALLPPNGSTQI
jgi:hypothetical protein